MVLLQDNNPTFSDMTHEEKKKIVESVRIYHPDFMEALERIEECRTHSRIASDPLCMIITGPSGAGKTTILESYKRQHERVINEQTKTRRNILYAQIPSPTTVKSLAEKLLKQMGDRFPHTGNIPQKTERLIHYIKDCQVELVMLDEFQHFYERKKGKPLYEVADWFKTVIDETKVPFILFGLEDSKKVLNHNEQLDRRFSIHHGIYSFGYHSDEEQDDFRQLLYELAIRLPFDQTPNLSDRDMSKRIYDATQGHMDSIMKLIRRASFYAIESDHETIELIDFAQAFEFHYRFRQKMDNPFLVEKYLHDDDFLFGDISQGAVV